MANPNSYLKPNFNANSNPRPSSNLVKSALV